METVMKIDLESLVKLQWTKYEDYLRARWPNGLGEYRIIGNTFGSYKYDENGKDGEASLIDLNHF